MSELTDLAQSIDDFMRTTLTSVTLSAAQAACKEVGVRRVRDDLIASLSRIADAQEAKRDADFEADAARQAVADARAEAEWLLGGSFVSEGNKTFLVATNADGEATERRQMTADEKRAWIARAVESNSDVAVAAKVLASAEMAQTEARDGLALANTANSALRHVLDAAVAELATLRTALTIPGASK